MKKEWILGWEARLLVLITAVLVVFGLASVYAASSSLVERGRVVGAAHATDQLVGAIVGAFLLVLASRLNLDKLRDLAWPIIAVTAFMLLLLLLPFTRSIAPRINGARRWLDIGVSVQVSELAKLAVVIWTAMLCARKGPEVRRLSKGLLPLLTIVGPMALMIALEPDLSVAVSITFIAMIVLFAGGARIGHFILLGVMALPLVWNQIQGVQYQLMRMTAFLDTVGGDRLGESYQIDQSLIGVGAGGLFGAGFGQGQQKLGFLPYPYSDFIFATIAEEWGFLGVVFLVSMYATFVWIALRLAKSAADPFRQLLGVGCAVMIGADAFLHMLVGVGLVPTTGLVLPFVSFGRSGLVTAMIATGLLINLGSRKRQSFA